METLFKNVPPTEIYLPKNISSYPNEEKFFSNRNLYRQINLYSETNVVTTSSNILLKNLKPLFHFFLKRYSKKDIPFSQYIKILIKYVTSKHIRYKDEYIWMGSSACDNYYHWITEVLIAILGLRHVKKNIPPLLISDNYIKINYVSDSLKYHKIKYKILEKNTFYHIDKIITPMPEGNDRLFNVNNLIVAKKELLKKEIINIDNQDYPGVYISREKAEKRKISNEKELINLLKKFNIKTIYTDNLSYFEQLKFFSQKRLLISIHGAGLVNQIFMPPQSTVIEIRHPKTDVQPLCFFDIAKALNYNYYISIAKPENETESPHTANLSLTANNLTELENILTEISYIKVSSKN